MTLKRKLITLTLAVAMVMAMAISSFAATPSVCKFTKKDGSPLKLGMDTGVIKTVDLDDKGIATVHFKEHKVLLYVGTINSLEGEAVVKYDPDKNAAKIDMNKRDNTGLPGVPLKVGFKFNMWVPMPNPVDARFVCEP